MPNIGFIEATAWINLLCVDCLKRLVPDEERSEWYCPQCNESIQACEVYAMAILNQYRPDRPVIEKD